MMKLHLANDEAGCYLMRHAAVVVNLETAKICIPDSLIKRAAGI